MLDHEPIDHGRWGRVIFYVDDVDATYRTALDAGHHPESSPRDADWGERYFHLDDPDGHTELRHTALIGPPVMGYQEHTVVPIGAVRGCGVFAQTG